MPNLPKTIGKNSFVIALNSKPKINSEFKIKVALLKGFKRTVDGHSVFLPSFLGRAPRLLDPLDVVEGGYVGLDGPPIGQVPVAGPAPEHLSVGKMFWVALDGLIGSPIPLQLPFALALPIFTAATTQKTNQKLKTPKNKIKNRCFKNIITTLFEIQICTCHRHPNRPPRNRS